MIELLKTRPTLDAIAAALSDLVQIDVRYMLIRCRKPPLPDYRHLFSVVAREFGYTYKAIGDFLGGRDHTTIVKNKRNFESVMDTEPALKRLHNRLINALTDTPSLKEQRIFSIKQIEREPA